MRSPDLGALFIRYRDLGDAAALAEVFDRLAPALLQIAHRLASVDAGPDDLVQATFLTAIERADRFDADRPLAPWLAGILAHLARNAHRRTARGTAPLPEVSHDDPVLDGVVSREERDAVQRAVEALPPRDRELITLRFVDGRSGPEIGRALDRSPVTVRSQLRRALDRLRRSLPGPAGALAVVGATTHADATTAATLSAMRDRVMEHAVRATAASATSGSTAAALLPTLASGSLLMSAKHVVVLLAAAALALLALQPLLAPDPPGSPARAEEERSADVLTAPDLRATAETGSSRAEAKAERPPAPMVVSNRVNDGRRSWQRATGRSSVRGRLVDDVTGRPVVDAAVWIGLRPFVATAPPADAVRCGPDGMFRIEGLRPNESRDLIAWSPDHAPLEVEVPMPPGDEKSTHDVDAGTLRLLVGASLAGRVLDASGAPVSDAEVRLCVALGWSNAFLPAYTRLLARSDAEGAFRVEHVPPSSGLGSRLFASCPAGIGALDVTLLHDDRQKDDLEIHLMPQASLQVDVIDDDGRPVEDALVEATPIAPPFSSIDYGRIHEILEGTVRPEVSPSQLGRDIHARGYLAADDPSVARHHGATDAHGRADFPALPYQGDRFAYHVIVEKKGYVTTNEDIVWVRAENEPLTLTLRREVRRTLTGRVQDAVGRPAVGVPVGFTLGYQGHRSEFIVESHTDRGGAFVLADLPPGKRGAVVAMPADGPWEERTLDVPVDHDPASIELSLREPGPIRGAVVDASGAPIAGALVFADQGGRGVLATQRSTAEDGRFELVDTSPGNWQMTVILPEPLAQWRAAQFALDVVAPQDDLRIVGEREEAGAAALSVTLVSGRTGLPLAAAQAFLRRADVSTDAFTNVPSLERSLGSLAGEGLKPGLWDLNVACEGFPTNRFPFEVHPGDTHVELRAEILGEGQIYGVVVLDDADAPGVANAAGDAREDRPERVLALLFGRGMAGTPVDANGERVKAFGLGFPLGDDLAFGFDGIDPGAEITLRVQGGGWTGATTIVGRGDEVTRVELRAMRGGTLRIRGPARWPDGIVTVTIGEPELGHAVLGSGADRTEQEISLPSGPHPYEVRWSRKQGVIQPGPGQRVGGGEVTIDAGETTVLDLDDLAPPAGG